MAASEHLSPELFHGTGGAIKGDTVYPSVKGAHGPGAYASPTLEDAEEYAKEKAQDEGRLFGTVYRVETMSKEPRIYKSTWEPHEIVVVDPQGLKVKEPVSYPINPDVDQGERT